jgi:hypothetical protein
MVRTSLFYLVLALLVGVWQALGPLVGWTRPGLFPVYFHLLVVGWLTLLIFGVAHWMFPKYSREQPRGRESLGWAVYILLNAGLLLRAAAEPLNTGNGGLWGWALFASALLQWLAGLLFVVNAWPRVKER